MIRKSILTVFLLVGFVAAQVNLGPIKVGGGTTISNSSNLPQLGFNNNFSGTNTYNGLSLFNGTSTQTLQNGTHFPDLFSGSDACAKIQADLNSISTYPRGYVDGRGLSGNQNCSGFTVIPGQPLQLASGTYSITATSLLREFSDVSGLTGHFNGTSGGTLFKAGSTLVGPMMNLQTINPGDWLHELRLQNMNFDGNKSVATTSTHCVQANSPFGEASLLHNLYFQNCKSAGFRAEAGGQVNLVLDNDSSFANGTYGFDFDQAGGLINARMISGDDSTNALIRFNAISTGNMVVTGFKAESKGPGLQPIVFDFSTTTANTGMLSARGGHASCSAGGSLSDIVKVTGTNEIAYVDIEDLWLNSACGTTNILNDTVSGVVVPLTLFGNGFVSNHISRLLYAPGMPVEVLAGGYRLMFNNTAIKFRNAANNANLNAVSFDSSNRVNVGDAAGIVLAGPIKIPNSEVIANLADAGMTFSYRAGATVDQAVNLQFQNFNGTSTFFTIQSQAGTGMQIFDNVNSKQVLSFDFAGGSTAFLIHKTGGTLQFKNSAGTTALQISDAGNVQVGAGTNTVYRCTVAGALPIGALTIASASCGTAVATTLQVN